jgi:hypothetical protein
MATSWPPSAHASANALPAWARGMASAEVFKRITDL